MGTLLQMWGLLIVLLSAFAADSGEAHILPDQAVAPRSPDGSDAGLWGTPGTLGNGSMLSAGVLETQDYNNNALNSSVLPSDLTVNGKSGEMNGTRSGFPNNYFRGNDSLLPAANGTGIYGTGINVTGPLLTVIPERVETGEERELRLLVGETQSLIALGEDRVPLNPRERDIVLLIGNTGAGKTTLAKFLTDVESLEAYDFGENILIRDIIKNGSTADHKISVSSTLVSKTIFPDRFIEPSTGMVIYDMPGFGDTRNSSVEIANAWFMKRVADHARRVKIILVAKHFSLRSGGTRTDFKSLLESAIDYMRVPAKFRDAIGLVATKVEGSKSVAKIIRGISFFLNQTATGLAEVFAGDEVKRNKTTELVDALRTNPDRISFIRQPEDVGNLADMDKVMEQHSHIQRLIRNTTRFVTKSREDFGISLSPKSQIVVLKITELTHAQVKDAMNSIREKLYNGFGMFCQTMETEAIGVLINTQKKLVTVTEELLNATTRRQYLQTLTTLDSRLRALPNVTIQSELAALDKYEWSFRFSEDMSNKTLPLKVDEWTIAMERLVKDSSELTTEVSMGVNRLIVQATYTMGSSMIRDLSQRVKTSKDKPQLLAQFKESLETVSGTVRTLRTARTFNEFAGLIWSVWNLRSNKNLTADFPTLTQDVLLEDESAKAPSPFKLITWVAPFDEFKTRVGREMDQLKLDIQTEAHIKDKQELERRYNETLKEQAIAIKKQESDYNKTLETNQRNMIDTLEQQNSYSLQILSTLKGLWRRVTTTVTSLECVVGDTGISTPTGSTRIKDLRPMDLVLNSRGQPVRVIAVNTVFVPGGSRIFGFRGSELGDAPFFTGGHTFLSPGGSILAQNKSELEHAHPQMRTEFRVEEMPLKNIQLQAFGNGSHFNSTVPELTLGFVEEREPLYFLAVEGEDGTYIANGFVCYHELPKFQAWPKTFVTIFAVASQYLPPREDERFTVEGTRLIGTMVQRIGYLWEEYIFKNPGLVPGGLEDYYYGPALEKISASYGGLMMNNPWQANFGLSMYARCGGCLHSHLDVQGLDPQPFIQIAINAIKVG